MQRVFAALFFLAAWALFGAGEELKAPPAGPALFEIGDCVMPRTAFAAM